MTEAAFIKANLQRWQNFEQILKNPSGKNPDKLKTLYLQLTDDVAYADTYFANGEITVYLHNLAGQVHKRVYRNQKNKSSRFADFWVKEVPEVSYRHRKQLLYALVVFSLSLLIGIFSAQQDENFVRLILGDAYVTMTEENIAKEDPMAVYKSMGKTDMFFAITFNNIRVSFIAFAFGLLSAIGTGFIMFKNGLMVGAFQFYFYQKGLFLTSFLTIWIHGTLEISAIIIAGAAGMIMGNGLFFPGSYLRAESFKRAAKDALKLAIGLVPIFITAGFLESFVTRQTEMHMAFKILIIGGSAAFIIFYFVIYPNKLRNYGIIKPWNKIIR